MTETLTDTRPFTALTALRELGPDRFGATGAVAVQSRQLAMIPKGA